HGRRLHGHELVSASVHLDGQRQVANDRGRVEIPRPRARGRPRSAQRRLRVRRRQNDRRLARRDDADVLAGGFAVDKKKGRSRSSRPASAQCPRVLANHLFTTHLNSSTDKLPPEPPFQISKPPNTSVKYMLLGMP